MEENTGFKIGYGYIYEVNEKRKSEDKVLNIRGLSLQNSCKLSNWVVLSGQIQSDSNGAFTFHSAKSNRVIDCAPILRGSKEAKVNFAVEESIESSHMPIVITFFCKDLKFIDEKNTDTKTSSPKTFLLKKYKWSERLKDESITKGRSYQAEKSIREIGNLINNNEIIRAAEEFQLLHYGFKYGDKGQWKKGW